MCLALLRRGRLESQSDILYFSDRDSWTELARRHHWEHVRFIKFPTLTKMIAFLPRLLLYKTAYYIGADVIDGTYGESAPLITCFLLRSLSAVGARVTILGCSFSRSPTADCVEALNTLPRSVEICARDHLSRERLQTALHRPVRLVADTSLSLEKGEIRQDSVKSLVAWTAAQRSLGNRIVGVNANYSLVPRSEGHTLHELADVYHRFIEEATSADPTLRYVFLGSDGRGQSEFRFADIIYQRMPSHLQSFCQRQAELCSFQEMKAICASLDLVITGRMHLSIASLGEGTPVGCIVYQGKFEGLIEGHFQLQDVLIEPAEAFAPGGLHKFLARLLPRLSEIREKIQERLPHVRELAEDNFRQPS